MDTFGRILRRFRINVTKTRRMMSSKGPQDKAPSLIQDIVISTVCPSNHGPVIDHMRKYFLHDEPMNKMFGFENPGDPIPDNENYLLCSMVEGLSLMAIHLPTSRIAGVAVSSPMSTPCHEGPKIDPRCARLSKIIIDIVDSLNLDENHPVDRILSFRALSIDSGFRGRRLSTRLILETEKMAREKGFELIQTEATSEFSQKAFESTGYETIWCKKYDDMVDEKGGKIFERIFPPHCQLKIMTKCL